MTDGGMRRRRRRRESLSRSLLILVLVVTATATLLTAATESSTSGDDSTLMRCWKVENNLDGEPVQVLATFTGASCAVSVDFPLVSVRFSPNESIPVFWTVRLLSSTQTTNDLKMKNPPEYTATSSPDNKGQLAQITATNVRVCASSGACDPTTASVAKSALHSGNFSTTGGSMLFQALNELSVQTPGSYVLAAQVRVDDDLDPLTSYYYSAFSDIFVTSDAKRTVVYDRQTTYCRRTAQSALVTTLLKSETIAESSSCELQVAVKSADVTQPNVSFAVSWEANLTRDATKDIRFPTPLTTVDVNSDRNYYEIVGSTITVCKKDVQCDEYSAASELLSVTGTTVLFGNFTNGVAKFTLSDVRLPASGMYGAFAHLVLAAPNNRRFDVTTYFQIVVTDEDAGKQVSEEQYVMGNGTFYCWQAVGLANSTSTVATTSVMAMAKNDDCPYEVDMTLSSTSISTSDALSVDWTVKQRSSYSQTKFSYGVNLTTVRDAATNSFVNLAQSAVYVCNTTVCTPFSAQKQLGYAASATNFTDGVARFTSQNVTIPSAGNYTLFVHAVMPNGDSFRFDSAAFASIAVSAAAVVAVPKKGSSVGTIIGVVAAVIGGVLLVLLVVISTRRYLAKRRRAPIKKVAVFGFRSHTIDSPERGDMPTASRDSIVSDTSMSFMYVKAAPSPVENIRANSLSYDPYTRSSFNDLSAEDANYTFALPDDLDKDEDPTASAEPQTYRF